MSINLVGINVIVMKKIYVPQRVMLQPYIDKDDHMNGTLWIEPKDENQIIVRIKSQQKDSDFPIKSDLAGSRYNYHFSGKEEHPCTLHV